MAEFEIEVVECAEQRKRVHVLYPDESEFDGFFIELYWRLTDEGVRYISIETDPHYEPQDIPALIAALRWAQEIAAQWAESEGDDDH